MEAPVSLSQCHVILLSVIHISHAYTTPPPFHKSYTNQPLQLSTLYGSSYTIIKSALLYAHITQNHFFFVCVHVSSFPQATEEPLRLRPIFNANQRRLLSASTQQILSISMV